MRIRVVGGPITVEADDVLAVVPAGNSQRLLGLVVAHGGAVTFHRAGSSIWPDELLDTQRVRLRNVLLRLRRAVGDVVVRSGSGVHLAPGVSCDLLDFRGLAAEALWLAKTDPVRAGRLAQAAVEVGDGSVLVDFEHEEWALISRRAAEKQLSELFHLLSVQAQGAGDLPLAQSSAERALRLDPDTDERYIQLAELLTLQGHVSEAIAVLDDAQQRAGRTTSARRPA